MIRGQNFLYALAVVATISARAESSDYSNLVQSYGPVAYWRLGETSGTTAVDTTGAHNGTYQNSVTLGVSGGIDGDADKSVTIGNGANDRVQVNPFGVSGTGITILAWFKTTGFGDDRFVAKATGTTIANCYWSLGTDSSSKLKAQINIAGTTQELQPSVSMEKDVWYFAAVTYDGSTMRVYLDATQVGSAAYSGAVSSDATVAVGLGNLPSGAGNRAFNGTIDELAVFDKQLTAAQISALFAAAGGGLRGHWKLTETSGTTAIDSSTQQNNGTYTNGAVLGSAGPYPGAGDEAADFDGSNDYVDVPNQALYDLTGPIAVAAWIKVDVFGVVDQAIVTKGKNAWRLQRDGSNNGVAFICDNLSTDKVASTVGVSDGKWHHIVGVYTGGQLQIYVDGVLDNSVSSSGSIRSNNKTVQIGRNSQSPSAEFDGSIHDARIYSRAISAAEVSQIYGLVGHWKFAEGNGTAAADSSGLANAATLSGGATWEINCAGNTALQTNGTSAIAQTNAAFTPPSEGTVAFWMRGSGPLSARGRLMGIGGDWEIRQEPNGTLSFDMGASPYVGNEPFSTLDPVDTNNKWYHIVVLFNAVDDSYSVYIDGQLRTSGISPVDLVPQAAGILTFGVRAGTTEYWKGGLRDFRIFNRRLNPNEIAQLSGLEAYWKLDETSGAAAADLSASGRTGTVVGAASWTAGKINNAIQLNGTNDVETSSLMGSPKNVTIAAWGNLSAADGSGAELVSIGNYFGLRLNEGATTKAFLYNGSSWVGPSVSQTYTGWHHFAAVFSDDADYCKLYIDGVEVASYSTTVTIPWTGLGTKTVIGAHGNGQTTYDFSGMIDDVRIYSRALCPSEIQQIKSLGGAFGGIKVTKWVEIQ